MNNDLISRSELKKAYFKAINETSIGEVSIIDLIDNAPTVEPTFGLFKEMLCGTCQAYMRIEPERPQGKWIKEDDEHLKGWYRCSECGRRVEDLTDDVVIHAGCEEYTIADIYPYCHCGADMRGGGTE